MFEWFVFLIVWLSAILVIYWAGNKMEDRDD